MSIINLKKRTAVQGPSTGAHEISFLENGNAYVNNTSGQPVKITDVIFQDDFDNLNDLTPKFEDKLYIDRAEKRAYIFNGSVLVPFNYMTRLFDDAAPIFAAPVGINTNFFFQDFIVADDTNPGEVCVLNLQGKMEKATNAEESLTKGLFGIFIQNENGNSSATTNDVGYFIIYGFVLDLFNNLDTGKEYYIGNMVGSITPTIPATSGSFVRSIGYAVSQNVLFVNPVNTYIELL